MRIVSTFLLAWLFTHISFVENEKSELKCELAAFLENYDGTEPMLIDSGSVVPTTDIKSCEENTNDCVKMVEQQVIDGTSGGNFTFTVNERDGYTVGDMLCDKADAVEENVRNKIVHIYWRLCGSPWKPTSFKMPQPLCCEDGLYVPCRTIKSEL